MNRPNEKDTRLKWIDTKLINAGLDNTIPMIPKTLFTGYVAVKLVKLFFTKYPEQAQVVFGSRYTKN